MGEANSEEIKISVIIPTYGTPIFLQKAIESVLSQTFCDFELIIVDDNNSDAEARRQTEDLITVYLSQDKRIKYIKHPRNLNGAVARNTGFAIAKGKYIALLDSDDEYAPARLQRCWDIMERSPIKIAGVYTGCIFKKHGKIYSRFTAVKTGNFLVPTLACRFMFCTGSNLFVRRRVIDELNGFDPKFLRHQDYEFLVRLFEKYDMEAIPELLVIKNNENFNLPDINKQIAIKEQYLSKFQPIIRSLSRKDQQYIMHSNCVAIAENALSQKMYSISKQYYNKSQIYSRLTFREQCRRIILQIYNRLKRK